MSITSSLKALELIKDLKIYINSVIKSVSGRSVWANKKVVIMQLKNQRNYKKEKITIEKLFNEIELALQHKHKYNSEDFSLYLEDYLCDNYDEIHEENAEVTELMNDEMPFICAGMESMMNDTEFLIKLKIEYDKAKELYYK